MSTMLDPHMFTEERETIMKNETKCEQRCCVGDRLMDDFHFFAYSFYVQVCYNKALMKKKNNNGYFSKYSQVFGLSFSIVHDSRCQIKRPIRECGNAQTGLQHTSASWISNSLLISDLSNAHCVYSVWLLHILRVIHIASCNF